MTPLESIIRNMKEIYNMIKLQYESDNCNKRILLEQLWVLKKLLSDYVIVEYELVVNINYTYDVLQREVFNYPFSELYICEVS